MKFGSLRPLEEVVPTDLDVARQIRQARLAVARAHPDWSEITDVTKGPGGFFRTPDEPDVLFRKFSGLVWEKATPQAYLPPLRFVVENGSLEFYEPLGRAR